MEEFFLLMPSSFSLLLFGPSCKWLTKTSNENRFQRDEPHSHNELRFKSILWCLHILSIQLHTITRRENKKELILECPWTATCHFPCALRTRICCRILNHEQKYWNVISRVRKNRYFNTFFLPRFMIREEEEKNREEIENQWGEWEVKVSFRTDTFIKWKKMNEERMSDGHAHKFELETTICDALKWFLYSNCQRPPLILCCHADSTSIQPSDSVDFFSIFVHNNYAWIVQSIHFNRWVCVCVDVYVNRATSRTNLIARRKITNVAEFIPSSRKWGKNYMCYHVKWGVWGGGGWLLEATMVCCCVFNMLYASIIKLNWSSIIL